MDITAKLMQVSAFITSSAVVSPTADAIQSMVDPLNAQRQWG